MAPERLLQRESPVAMNPSDECGEDFAATSARN
jgi:hypothetical protein